MYVPYVYLKGPGERGPLSDALFADCCQTTPFQNAPTVHVYHDNYVTKTRHHSWCTLYVVTQT